jgi:hypothetical protein
LSTSTLLWAGQDFDTKARALAGSLKACRAAIYREVGAITMVDDGPNPLSFREFEHDYARVVRAYGMGGGAGCGFSAPSVQIVRHAGAAMVAKRRRASYRAFAEELILSAIAMRLS